MMQALFFFFLHAPLALQYCGFVPRHFIPRFSWQNSSLYTTQEGNCLRVRGIDVIHPKVKEMTSAISKNNVNNLKPGNKTI